MPLDSFAALPDGGQVLVEGEAQDVVRRIKEGDPTKGWEGDPTMHVVVQPYEGVRYGKIKYMFEVIGYDAENKPYIAVTSDTCGPELIDLLIRADTRRRDVIAELMKAQEQAEAAKRAARSELHEDMADRLGFALQSENAAHLGGKGRLHRITDKWKAKR